jgi:hypothetical protein
VHGSVLVGAEFDAQVLDDVLHGRGDDRVSGWRTMTKPSPS